LRRPLADLMLSLNKKERISIPILIPLLKMHAMSSILSSLNLKILKTPKSRNCKT
jgi:hypothetical protein